MDKKTDIDDSVGSLSDKYLAKIKLCVGKKVVWQKDGSDHRVLTHDGLRICKFRLKPLSGCHGIVIFHAMEVSEGFRGKGVGKATHEWRLEASRLANFTCALCTTVATNAVENHILQKYNWNKVSEFTNKKTGNPVVVWMLNLG
jgi:hypothetical protein